jgi:hypothetical protein
MDGRPFGAYASSALKAENEEVDAIDFSRGRIVVETGGHGGILLRRET